MYLLPRKVFIFILLFLAVMHFGLFGTERRPPEEGSRITYYVDIANKTLHIEFTSTSLALDKDHLLIPTAFGPAEDLAQGFSNIHAYDSTGREIDLVAAPEFSPVRFGSPTTGYAFSVPRDGFVRITADMQETFYGKSQIRGWTVRNHIRDGWMQWVGAASRLMLDSRAAAGMPASYRFVMADEAAYVSTQTPKPLWRTLTPLSMAFMGNYEQRVFSDGPIRMTLLTNKIMQSDPQVITASRDIFRTLLIGAPLLMTAADGSLSLTAVLQKDYINNNDVFMDATTGPQMMNLLLGRLQGAPVEATIPAVEACLSPLFGHFIPTENSNHEARTLLRSLARYFTYKWMRMAGVITPLEYTNILKDSRNRYMLSPLRTSQNLLSTYGSDELHEKTLFQDKSLLAAFQLDRYISHKTNHAFSLEDALRLAADTKKQHGPRPLPEALVSAVSELSGENAVPMYETLYLQAGRYEPENDPLVNGLVPEDETANATSSLPDSEADQ